MKKEAQMLGKKIVVVDDDESIRKTFFLILNKHYRVYLAKDGQEVLDRFKNADIDLIIADYKLPSQSGVELVAEMRKKGYKGDVILISAHPDMIEPDVLSRLSISCFFAKPLDLTALSRSIDYLLTAREKAERHV
jgi:DNA-binding NtrC family response regulator